MSRSTSRVDFAAKRVGGTATLDIEAKPDAKEIILDDKGLEIAEHRRRRRQAAALQGRRGRRRSSARRLTIALGDARKIVVTLQVGARQPTRCNG